MGIHRFIHVCIPSVFYFFISKNIIIIILTFLLGRSYLIYDPQVKGVLIQGSTKLTIHYFFLVESFKTGNCISYIYIFDRKIGKKSRVKTVKA